MNPDIQRIAEKWAEGYKDPQVSAYEVIKAALEELSALRDTQERELRERLPADWFEDASLETWFPLTAETLKEQEETIASLRAELARRDEVEKELRERIGELTERVLKWQKFGTSKAIDLRETRISLSHLLSAEASLRSRIGELEDRKS